MKMILSDREKGKAYNIELTEEMQRAVIGKKIGDVIAGDIFGLKGYKIKITGGSDKDGFPMKPSISGSVRRKVLMRGMQIGYKPKLKGQIRRKNVRGNTVASDIVQINAVIEKKGKQSIEKLLGLEKGEEKAENIGKQATERAGKE